VPQPGWLDPGKLIDAAEHLAGPNTGPGRPRHAFLRRAVSTSYYALFHALCVESACALLADCSDTERLAIARAVGHQPLKDCCGWIAGRQGGTPREARAIVDTLKQSQFVGISDTFCDLQEARHRADYDHTARFSKATTLAHIAEARRAIADLEVAGARDRQGFATLAAFRSRLQ
jgi:hypothetical protein